MYDTTKILTTHQPLNASSDEYGKYGSVYAPDSDYEVPSPSDLYSEPHHDEKLLQETSAASNR